tara:strand:- start:1026 stop:1331 length:306 start_codon:yes stop_codon:yes gene_type:complete
VKWKTKYNAVLTERDGIKFHSKKEAGYYDELKLRKEAGEILFFLRQTPFHLPGNVKYVCDFVEFHANGDVLFVDVKGQRTPAYKRSIKQVKAYYGIEIDEV